MGRAGIDLARRRRRAEWTLGAELLARLLWPAASWLAGFAGVALLDLLPMMTSRWHALILAAAGAGFVLLLFPLRRWRRPDAAAITAKLERDSELRHRPLDQLEDRPAGESADGLTGLLWRLQTERNLAIVKSLRVRSPMADLARWDPVGLRFAALLILAVGLAVGRHDALARIERALDPGVSFGAPPRLLEVWLTPPAATGQAMRRLLPSDAPLSLPAGSKLLAQLQGASSKAKLILGNHREKFTRLDDTTQTLETRLDSIGPDQKLEITLGWRELASWKVSILADQPPAVAFIRPPAGNPDGRLSIAITAHDDYRVDQLALRVSRQEQSEDIPLSALGSGPDLTVERSLDLAAHFWSGLPVELAPVAIDSAGQETVGASVALTLPERSFRNAVARQIAQERHRLASDPYTRPSVADRLAEIASRPDLFDHDLVVFLQLVTARSRLFHDNRSTSLQSVLDMLWAAASRVEEGDVPDARAALDQAADALSQALTRGASDDEITDLTNQLNRAMQKLLQSLAKQGGKQGVEPGNGKAIGPDQLQAMMRQMSDLAHAGARDAATRSLQKLRDLLDQLKSGGASAGKGSDSGASPSSEALQQLEALSDAQRSLLDHPNRGPSGAADAQQGLADKLEKWMQSQPGAASALAPALRSMEDAVRSLRSGQPGPAAESQGQAIERMQDAVRNIAEQQGGAGEDPFGRTTGDGEGVKVPTDQDVGQSRKILEEVRRRLNQLDRSGDERAYLRRLLDHLY